MKPIKFKTYVPCPETLSIQLNDQISVYYWRVQDDKKLNLSNLRRAIDPLRSLHSETNQILEYLNIAG
jgi:predicted RNA-binding protein (virulence factor B family)